MRKLLTLLICVATTGCVVTVSRTFPNGDWDAKAGWSSIYAPVEQHPHPAGGPDGPVRT